MILDGYAGAGGWDEGIRLAGAGPVVGVDNWLDACRTGRAAGHARICADVSTYPTGPFAGRLAGQVWSPPCQPWSTAGAGLGKVDQPRVHALVDRYAAGRDDWQSMTWADPRSHHAAQPVRWIRDLRPGWVCMEQVPAVLPLWEHIGRVLAGWGYSVWTGRLCAADYGVPQTRVRAFLIASRSRRAAPPMPTHYDPRRGRALFGLPWVSMAAALGWNGLLETANRSKTAAGHTPYVRATDRPSPTLLTNADRWEVHARPGNMRWVLRNGTQDNACERDMDEPAGTLFFGQRLNDVSWVARRPATTVAGDPRVSPPGHQDRAGGEWQHAESLRVTVVEAAILQGFRPDYPWQGTKTSQFHQVGNAVPPPLAAAVVGAVADA